MLPAECDKQFLDIAARLDRYGMDFHQIIVGEHVVDDPLIVIKFVMHIGH